MSSDRPTGITLPQFTTVFVPFGLLLAWALLAPELGPALDVGRTKLTIWATSLLLMPALVLYLFRSVGQGVANLAHLFWTFAYLAFLIHAWWATFIVFDGVADTFRQMGTLVAGGNFLLTILWGIDVVLLWAWRRPPHWLGKAQLGVRIVAFLVFGATLLVLRGGPVRILGIVFTAVVLLALLLRFWAHVRVESAQTKPA
jgi:hypothetical protein